MFKLLKIPREMKFYYFFEQSARNLVVAGEKLEAFFESYVDIEAKVAEIKALEHRGDAITHEIMAQLHRTFVTPLDREDIALLAKSLDDFMDFIEGAATRMLIYRVARPSAMACELVSIIVEMTRELDDLLPRLRHPKQFKQILERCVVMNTLENRADEIFHSALGKLFDEESDIRELIKWREIYECLESATDRGEDVANVLEGIVLKHA